MSELEDRCRLLMRSVSIKALNKSDSAKEADRWRNLRKTTSTVRITGAEIERLSEIFPEYKWWILTGDVKPEIGQTSPDYDEANNSLKEAGEG